jgi:hypothetical protein
LNERGQVYRIDAKTTGADREVVGKFHVEMQRAQLSGVAETKLAAAEERKQQAASRKETRWHDRDETKMEQRINRMQAEAEKNGKSLAAELYAEGLTLARVDDKGKKIVEAEHLRRYENANLKDIREGTHDARLRKADFAEGELVAVDRWGEAHRLNPLFIDTEKLEHAATGGSDKTPTLSAAREFFATDRKQQKQDRADVRDTFNEAKQTQRNHDRTENAFKAAPAQAASKATDAGLKVLSAGGAIKSLSSIVESLFSGTGDKPPPTSEEKAMARAIAALESIEVDMEAGRDLKEADVKNLLPYHHDQLKRDGDDAMRAMIADLKRERQEQEQEQERGYGGRTRDR